MASHLNESERCIRRLRKKLRQIEHLEALDRELNSEEIEKVGRKSEHRKDLAKLLQALKKAEENDDVGNEEMKRRSNDGRDAAAATSQETSQPAKAKKLAAVTRSRSSTETLSQDEQLEISIPSTPKRTTTYHAETTTSSPSAAASTATSVVAHKEATSSVPEQEFVQVVKTTPSRKAGDGAKRSPNSTWRNKDVRVQDLPGHEDMILASVVDPASDLILTSSRDTTVLIRKLSTLEQVGSLRGHTGAVTGLALLPKCLNHGLGIKQDGDTLAISGSVDCSLKVWNVTQGKMVKSIYTYNVIKCLGFCEVLNCAVTGTDGGKMELFDLVSGQPIQSLNAHDDVVTSLSVGKHYISTGSRDGVIKVWDPKVRKQIRCLYVSETVQTVEEDQAVHVRCISAIAMISDDFVAYGDSGHNIKVLSWKKGLLFKVPNHVNDVGFTDCLSIVDSDHLLASSFDVDHGIGHVNLFRILDVPAGESSATVPLVYECSWIDDYTGRIFGLSASAAPREEKDGAKKLCSDLVFVTGGREAKVWRTSADKKVSNSEDQDCILVKSVVLPLVQGETVDSGSSGEDSDSDECSTSGSERSRSSSTSSRGRRSVSSNATQGWGCSVM